MKDDQALSMLSAIAHETRLAMLKALVRAEPKGLTAGDIAAVVDATPSRASFHLANLAKAEVVTSTRSSREIIYRANMDQVGNLLGFLLHDCCAGDAGVLACCAAPEAEKDCC